ncbi:MAG: metal ABC transporter permease [Pseudomonadota bacterium]
MDTLFLMPFLAGLPLAILLPLVGTLLRLRDEWLAALGLAHLAGATGLAGLAIQIPAVLGAPAGALAGGVLKYGLGARGNSVFALMILAGWAVTLLIAANTALGDSLAHAVVDGQLYFAGPGELTAALVTGGLGLAAMPWLTPRLIRARLFPQHEIANRLPRWRWQLGFDLLAALAVAVGTATLGLMAAFALVFLPAWIAFRAAPGWRTGYWIAAGTGLFGYLLAFAAALHFDQPFGPVLVATLAVLFAFTRWFRG